MCWVSVADGRQYSPDYSVVTAHEDNCNRQYNYEKPATLEREAYEWRIERDQYGVKLCLRNDKVNGCAYRQ